MYSDRQDARSQVCPAFCEDWLTNRVVWEVGIHCVGRPGAGFVRIGSQIGWLGSRNLLFYRLVYPVCEDWLTQWVVGRSESTVLSVLVLGL